MAETRTLPPEYQAGLDEAEALRLLALQLSKQQAPVPQGQMVGGYYIKPSNLQYLTNMVGGQQANRASLDSQAMRQQVMNKYATDAQRAQEEIVRQASPREQELAGPPAVGETMGTEMIPPNLMKAERNAQASPFPNVQALAKTIGEQRMKLFDEAAKTSGSESVRQGAIAGGDPTKLTPNVYGAPEVTNLPGVGNIVISRDQRGNVHQTGIQRPAEAATDKFGRQTVELRLADLQKTRPDVANAPAVQRSLFDAYRIVKSGLANTGALATQVTGLQALAARFGAPAPTEVPVTQYLQHILAPALAETLKTIRGVGAQSNAELKVALDMALNVDKDIRSIEAMIIHGLRAVEFARNEYNGQLDTLLPAVTQLGGPPEIIESMRVPGGIGDSRPGPQNMNEEEYRAIFQGGALDVLKQPSPGAKPKARSVPWTPPQR